jgi:hypothetical protein
MDSLQQAIDARAKALETLERAQTALDEANATIAHLLGMKSRPASSLKGSVPAARKQRVLTEEGRAKIVAAQHKRWEALRDLAAGRT